MIKNFLKTTLTLMMITVMVFSLSIVAFAGEDKTTSGETLVKEADGKWYYYLDGEKQETTTLVKYSGKWFYIEDGVWQNKANTLFKYNGKWFYIEKGKWNSKANLLFLFNGKTFYIEKGKWSSTVTTIAKFSGKWHYIKNGKWSKDVAIVPYMGKHFFVREGYAKLNFSGGVVVNNKYYQVRNGKVVV